MYEQIKELKAAQQAEKATAKAAKQAAKAVQQKAKMKDPHIIIPASQLQRPKKAVRTPIIAQSVVDMPRIVHKTSRGRQVILPFRLTQ